MIDADDLFERSPAGQLVADVDWTVVRVNRTLLEWTGHAREQVVGRRFDELLAPGARIYHETHLAPLLHMQDEVRELALTMLRAGGGRLDVLVNGRLHRDEARRPAAIQLVVVDARARRAYERELQAERDRERTARERAEAIGATLERLADER